MSIVRWNLRGLRGSAGPQSTGATFPKPEGLVPVDPKYCIARGYCVQACPCAARFINQDTRTAGKCTGRHHRVVAAKMPACFIPYSYPAQARQFGGLKDSEAE